MIRAEPLQLKYQETLAVLRARSWRVSWQSTVLAVFLAGACAILGYVLFDGRQSYSEFVTGYITFHAESKNQDYACILGGFLGFVGAYCTASLLENSLFERLGPKGLAAIRTAMTWSLLPAAIFAGQLVLFKFQNGMFTLALLVMFGTFSLAAVAAIRRITFAIPEQLTEAMGASVTVPLLVALSGLGFVLCANRLFFPVDEHADSILFLIGLAIGLSTAGVFALWSFAPPDGAAVLRRRLGYMVTGAQAGLPLLFLELVPRPSHNTTGRQYEFQIGVITAVCASLAAVAIFDMFRRARNPSGLFGRISPFCLAAVLIFLKSGPVAAPYIDVDDYHTAEYMLPWWLTHNFGFIPFWDYVPARGLYNYVPGILANLVFDGKAPAYIAVTAISGAFFLLPGYWLISRFTGLLAAFLILLSYPAFSWLSEIDLWITGALILFVSWFKTKSPSHWLVAWLLTGVFLVLFAPGQGFLLLIATVPLAAVKVLDGARSERRQMLKLVAITLALLGVVALVTPLGKMLLGAVRYAVEQSAVNSTAHGVPISDGMGIQKPLNPILWEILRASFIVVAAWSAILAVRAFLSPDAGKRNAILTLAVPITLVLALFVVRAAGRVDPGLFYTRMGIASCWAVGLLAPLLLITTFKKQKLPTILLGTTFAASLVNVYLVDFDLSRISREPFGFAVQDLPATDGPSLGLANIGKATFHDQGQLKRLVEVRKVLDRLLKPGETYLDFTNRSADYFYVGLPPPIESAPYNLPSTAGQIRAVDRLRKSHVPVALVGPNNILFDGGSSSLRCHLVYRYLVEHYVPVKIGATLWMVILERAEQAKAMAREINSQPEPDGIAELDMDFLPGDLAELPYSWGKSAASLSHRAAHIVRRVSLVSRTSKNETFQFSPVDGRDAGILAFKFHCQDPAAQPGFWLTWGSGPNPDSETANRAHFRAVEGAAMVPLDAFPRWLTATGITHVDLQISEPAGCPAFWVSDTVLLERAAAAVVN